jgi:hypothetical protein
MGTTDKQGARLQTKHNNGLAWKESAAAMYTTEEGNIV